MKIIADKSCIKVVGVPVTSNRPNEMLDFVGELATQAPVSVKGDTIVVQYATKQKETKNDN